MPITQNHFIPKIELQFPLENLYVHELVAILLYYFILAILRKETFVFLVGYSVTIRPDSLKLQLLALFCRTVLLFFLSHCIILFIFRSCKGSGKAAAG